MKQFSLLVLLFLSLGASLQAQHKIIWEVSSGDTSVQRMLYRQVNNVLNAAPDTKIEIVYHGLAIYAVLQDTGHYKNELKAVQQRGVLIAACANSLRNRGIDPVRVMKEAFIVPVAILELVQKQEKGWSYIKAGN
ncbi:MAG TPA: DsrE family protein [Lacibacter sp.]|nr:DsrE family protein [Lacibacter sp.]HMO88217.1 DsrE family protein [Lacibacter sp.]HMP87482.1 DsrE family protein [Lacibacter sp.]